MIRDVLISNVKNLIDAEGAVEMLMRGQGKTVYQVSIGGKSGEDIGWHFVLENDTCLFHRGVYKGDIVIDWNEEFKFKAKSRKQIEAETTPDYNVLFKSDDAFNDFVAQCVAYGCDNCKGKRPKVKGKKRSGSKCNGELFESILVRAVMYQMSDKFEISDDAQVREYAARLLLFTVPQAIHTRFKEGVKLYVDFVSGIRRSYFFELKDGRCATWLTVQDTSAKVTANQGTRLPAFFGLSFDDEAEAIRFFFATEKERAEMYDKVVVFRGAGTYGSDYDEATERQRFINVVQTAVSELITH